MNLSGNMPASPGPIMDLHGAAPKQLRLAEWLWREGRWPVVAWLGGIATAALWIYAGMPMICH